MPNYKALGFTIALLISLLAPVGAQTSPNPPSQTKKQNNPSNSTLSLADPKQADTPQFKSCAQPEKGKDKEQIFTLTPAPKTTADWVVFGASLVLAAVGVGGIVIAAINLCLIRKQYLEMAKQRFAMQKQAGTMDRQTKVLESSFAAMVSKERGRLSIEIVDFDLGEIPVVNYRLTCHGTTPAFIHSSWEMTGVLPLPDFPWRESAYGLNLRGLPEVVANGTSENYVFILETDRKNATPESLTKDIKDGKLYLHFRVRIVYEDVFGGQNELCISKIYGVPPIDKDSSGMLAAVMRPEWHNSRYEYGQNED